MRLDGTSLRSSEGRGAWKPYANGVCGGDLELLSLRERAG